MKFVALSIALAAINLDLLASPVLAQSEDQLRRRTKQVKDTKAPKSTKASKSTKAPKATKAPKSPKAPKSMKPDSLVALIEPPGGVTDSDVFGTAGLRYNMDGSILVSVNLTGLKTSVAKVILSDGTGCDHYDDFSDTPYICSGSGSAEGAIDAIGVEPETTSRSAFRIDNGCTKEENIGKTIIIIDDDQSDAGCGILGEEAKEKVLVADMSSYPEYSGSLTPSGKVTVSFNDDDTFTFSYDVSGLEEDCVDCGIHIHAGTSCATPADVKGHGWNSVVVQDLWSTAGGATYTSDSMGNAEGYFSMTNGYGYEANANHAVVIHRQDGTRVGCGVLN